MLLGFVLCGSCVPACTAEFCRFHFFLSAINLCFDVVIWFLIGLFFVFYATLRLTCTCDAVYRRELHWCSMPLVDSATRWI